MSKSWTNELSRRGGHIRANVIAPGYINTPILEPIPQKNLDAMFTKILFRGIGEPSDVAGAALFFASDDSAYVTGQVLEVSGGLGMRA